MNSQFSQRSDWSGLKQALGVLLVATCTGAFTFFAWRAGYWLAALLGLIVHGNVCSLFISAVHELAHRTVFRTHALNVFFGQLFGFLNWTSPGAYYAAHKGHHRFTNHHEHDTEFHGSCRPLWLGTFIWSAVFNLPRFLGGFFKCPTWMAALHTFLATAFILSGIPEFVLLVTLAPFCFGWLELVVNYPQHAGMKVDAADLRETTRTLRLPGWLSFLHWRMEYHWEHHQWPAVPCYHLPALREALEKSLTGPVVPQRKTLFEAWRFILSNRTPDRCGHGPNPLQKLTNSLTH